MSIDEKDWVSGGDEGGTTATEGSESSEKVSALPKFFKTAEERDAHMDEVNSRDKKIAVFCKMALVNEWKTFCSKEKVVEGDEPKLTFLVAGLTDPFGSLITGRLNVWLSVDWRTEGEGEDTGRYGVFKRFQIWLEEKYGGLEWEREGESVQTGSANFSFFVGRLAFVEMLKDVPDFDPSVEFANLENADVQG